MTQMTRRQAVCAVLALPLAGFAFKAKESEAYELIQISHNVVTIIDVDGKPFHTLNQKEDIWYIGNQMVSINVLSSKEDVDRFIYRHMEEQGTNWIIRVCYNKITNKYGVFALQK